MFNYREPGITLVDMFFFSFWGGMERCPTVTDLLYQPRMMLDDG
jgi:hypothetical protein